MGIIGRWQMRNCGCKRRSKHVVIPYKASKVDGIKEKGLVYLVGMLKSFNYIVRALKLCTWNLEFLMALRYQLI